MFGFQFSITIVSDSQDSSLAFVLPVLQSSMGMMFSALVSGVLYALSQPSASLWGLGYLCLSPWLFSIWAKAESPNAATAGRAALSGLLLGTVAALGCGFWALGTLATLGASPLVAAGGTLLAAIWTKGVPFAALGAWAALSAPCGQLGRVASITLGVVLMETLLSTATWGAPWALLAHSQTGALGIAQLAAVGGELSVTAMLAATNGALASWALDHLHPTSMRLATTLIGAAAALQTFAVPVLQTMRSDRTDRMDRALIVVQPLIPLGERWMPGAQRTHLTSALSIARSALGTWDDHDPPIVVFPEMLVTAPIETRPGVIADLKSFARHEGAELIVGVAREAISRRSDRYRNSVVWVASDGSVKAALDKVIAIPIVEAGSDAAMTSYLARLLGRTPHVEESHATSNVFGSGEFAIALCYEVMFRALVADRRGSRAQAILVLADDSWTPGTAPSEQILAAATFRSIEQRLPLVRVAIQGPSLVIDRWGRRFTRVPKGHQGTFEFPLAQTELARAFESIAILTIAAIGGASGWAIAFLWRHL